MGCLTSSSGASVYGPLIDRIEVQENTRLNFRLNFFPLKWPKYWEEEDPSILKTEARGSQVSDPVWAAQQDPRPKKPTTNHIGRCVSYLPHHCDETLDQSNLRKEGFILAPSQRAQSMEEGREGVVAGP